MGSGDLSLTVLSIRSSTRFDLQAKSIGVELQLRPHAIWQEWRSCELSAKEKKACPMADFWGSADFRFHFDVGNSPGPGYLSGGGGDSLRQRLTRSSCPERIRDVSVYVSWNRLR